MKTRTVEVLIVGAGPAGLGVAAGAAAEGDADVLVIEREQQPGGVPRHCFHGGFGRPGRPMTGPEYARAAVEKATRAGAELRTGVTALGWAGPRILDTTGPGGLERITARAVVLATGARERPRSARLVPGTRPAGVFTTGELQQTVHLHGLPVGSRAVVVGAEPVAYAAVDTLRRAGVEVAAMVTPLPHTQAHAARARNARLRHGVPLITRTTVTALTGRPRLRGVRIRRDEGTTTTTRTIACDTVVFTGDFVPDHEVARHGGLTIDPGTRGPAVDATFRTSQEGVFAVGNLLHGAESAPVAAYEGERAALPVLGHLAGRPWPTGEPVPLRADAPLAWVVPNRLTCGTPLPGKRGLVLRTTRFLARPTLLVTQDGRPLHREHHWRTAVPGRPLYLDGGWLGLVVPEAGPVHVAVE